MSLALAAAISIALFSQETQVRGATMVERISARVESAAPEACDMALAEAGERNAEALFTGASICGAGAREEDAIFLLLAGQARAMADMALTMPETPPDASDDGVIDLSNAPAPPHGVIELYGFIYAYAGGAGSTEFYRDVDRTDRLFDRLEAWKPRRPAGYSPGWDGSRAADETAYADSIKDLVAGRRDQILSLAHLYRNDAYYALQVELEALMAANNNTFQDGTPAHDRLEAIQADQARIAQQFSLQSR